MTAQEQATIFAAREILARHINRNPVLSSWQAVMDYCAFSVRGEVERFHVLYLDRKNRLTTSSSARAGKSVCAGLVISEAWPWDRDRGGQGDFDRL
ncbi:MAG: hypothetical protein V4583_03635, partial [Pseudomonadota bacterium]